MDESRTEGGIPGHNQEFSKTESTDHAKPKAKVKRWKKAGVALAATGTLISGVGAAAVITELQGSVISRLVQPDVKDIPSYVPPQLNGKDIPQTNEHYRTLLDVLRTGIDDYVKEGGKPFYKRPSYYLTSGEALKNYALGALHGDFRGLNTSGKPYDAAVGFCGVVFDSPDSLYEVDPGTSTREEVDKKLAELDGYKGVLAVNGSTTDEQQKSPQVINKAYGIIAQTYGEHFMQTKKAIDEIRGTDRVSTSVLLQYYLNNNHGDIVKSLWDTTLFLKLAARVDIQKMINTQDPVGLANPEIDEKSRHGAELVSSMFYDEFADKAPLEWLLSAVSPRDEALNTSDMITNTGWKDYMPINRAGLPYHAINLAAMEAVMDPPVVEEMLTGYLFNLQGLQSSHGKIKVTADLKAVHEGRAIRMIFDQYRET